jgi:homoserine kinase
MRLRVSVPGTSANLGPGFDALALALDLRTVATCAPSPPWRCRVSAPA